SRRPGDEKGVPRRRFERPTCRLGGGCPIQLSYRSMALSAAQRRHCKEFYRIIQEKGHDGGGEVSRICRRIRQSLRVSGFCNAVGAAGAGGGAGAGVELRCSNLTAQ